MRNSGQERRPMSCHSRAVPKGGGDRRDDAPIFWCAHLGGKGARMQSNDEQAIFSEIEAFTDAWNKGDAKAAAAFFTEDGVRVGAFGDVQHGRTEIEAAYE